MTDTAPRYTEYLPLDDLQPADWNPKNHHADIGASLERFGYVEAITMDERTAKLVAGHGRRDQLLAKRDAGEHPPEGVVVAEDGRWMVPVQRGWHSADDDEAAAYVVASNQTSIAGGWDTADLDAGLAELAARNIDLTGLGFDADELIRVSAHERHPPGEGEDPPARPFEPDEPAPRDRPVTVDVRHGDCVELMRAMPDASVHAIVTDPPYGIDFMGKGWDDHGTGAGFQAFTVGWATEALRVLKPGGHVVAFGGTRMFHRLAAGLEDAGFEIRDCLSWMYGSGFPKSLDVSKAIDRAAGVEREVVGSASVPAGHAFAGPTYDGDSHAVVVDVTTPTTPEAIRWDGWGTALKPAWEPIVLARKPLGGTIVGSVLEHGTGALNVAGARIGDVGGGTTCPDWPDAGRWPANVVLDEEAAALLDEQTGITKSTRAPRGGTAFAAGEPGGDRHDGHIPAGHDDEGGASRFFYVAKASTAERNAGTDGLEPREVNEALEPGDPGYDNPRAGAGRGGAQRNFHPTVKPIALMRWLIRLITPPGGIVLDPFVGSGSTLVASVLEGFDVIGCELTDEYLPIIRARVAWAEAVVDAAGVTPPD